MSIPQASGKKQSAFKATVFVRLIMSVAVVGSVAGAALVGMIATAAPAAAQTCSGDMWKTAASGTWDTASDWSSGVPTGTTQACITLPGNYTVSIGNETINDPGVTVFLGSGSGTQPTLVIGNSGSGEPAVTFAGVTNAGTVAYNWGGTFTVPGAFTSTGTVDVSLDTPSAISVGSFDNQGTFQTGATTAYTLPTTSSNFLNDSTGILDVPSTDSITFSSPSGQTGVVTQDGVIDNSGTLVVNDELSVEGGSICGTAPQVGSNGGSVGTLAFASTVSTGSACGTGPTDQIAMANIPSAGNGTLEGSIPAAYTVTIGNGGSSCAVITISGPMTNSGTLEPQQCATLNSTAAITNSGTIEVPNIGSGVTFDLTSFTNNGAFEINDTSTYTLPTSASTFANGSTGTLSIAATESLTVSSPSGTTATVTQDGVINNAGTLVVNDELSVGGGSICGTAPQVGSNGGTVGTLHFASTVASGPVCGTGPTDQIAMANIPSAGNGTLSGNIPSKYTVVIGNTGSSCAYITISGALTNSGTLEPGLCATLIATGAITNKGTFAVQSGSSGITVNFASFTNDGSFDVNEPVVYDLPKPTSTLVNASTGIINVATSESLTVSSPSGKTATVTQDGTINNSGTLTIEDELAVNGGSICGTAPQVGVDDGAIGTLAFATTVATGPACVSGPTDQIAMANITSNGTLTGTIPKGYTLSIGNGGSGYAHVAATTKKNLGTFVPEDGATVTFASKFKNKGTIDVPSTGYDTALIVGGNLTNDGTFEVDGVLSVSIKSGDAFINDPVSGTKGNLQVGDAPLDITGPLDNEGLLSIAAGGSVDVSLTYTQATSGLFEPQVASASSYGVLNVTGDATLAGTLEPTDAAGYTPPVSTTWTVLNSAGLSGTFSTVSGAFSAQYTNSNKDVQITAT
ncbi:MAG: hypothetical protein WAM97_08050 [Acidimicrobiales bacterium]